MLIRHSKDSAVLSKINAFRQFYHHHHSFSIRENTAQPRQNRSEDDSPPHKNSRMTPTLWAIYHWKFYR